ncbi:TonB-dependent receptor [Marinicauda pacifica]|uniref:TonB-dependent receptor n=1 Tax=Marinicauda pacifica TaxID=1133559 RepID=A0A4S2HDQ7_9PROT|nr:TonB-dependent receptor [Marinicauda pacifica]TGY94134.1 TonB-dependent receptor [Marinicauda pacifica]
MTSDATDQDPAMLLAALALAITQASPGDDVIVVSGARTGEVAETLATPVTVFDRAELRRIGAQHISEILNRSPGVFINRGNGVEHLTAIRSPVFTGGAGAGSFLYLEDGIPLRAAGFANINGLFEAVDDLAGQIEVIRGPGGAVYGSNALHGLVNVITPEPDEAGRLAELEAGSFGRVRARAYAGGETGFGSGFIGLGVRHENGWRDDAQLDRSTLQTSLDGAAGALDWSLRASLVDLDQETATYVSGFKAYEDEALSQQNADPEAFRNARAARVSLHLDQNLSQNWRATGAVYGRSNEMDFRLHFLPSEALETTGHDSLGLQSALVRETETSRFMLGMDGEWTNGFLIENQTQPGFGSFPQGLHYDYAVEAGVAAVFAQGRFQLSERLSLEGGARLEQTRYDYDNRTANGVTGRYLRPADRSDSFTTFAPHAGVVFDATDRLQLFARAARGVRAPQTAELYRLDSGQQVGGFDPEELDSLEAGLRMQSWASGRIELVGFTMDKTNVFFRDANGFNVSDAETTHDGVEASLVQPLGDRLTVSASVTWAVHEYAFADATEGIAPGNRVDTAPEWLWNVRAVWEPTFDSQIEAEWIHVDEYFADAANTARYEGHDLLNLRARYTLRPGLDVFSSIRNVLDDRYAERADYAFGNYRYFPGEPRSVSVGVRLSR